MMPPIGTLVDASMVEVAGILEVVRRIMSVGTWTERSAVSSNWVWVGGIPGAIPCPGGVNPARSIMFSFGGGAEE